MECLHVHVYANIKACTSSIGKIHDSFAVNGNGIEQVNDKR